MQFKSTSKVLHTQLFRVMRVNDHAANPLFPHLPYLKGFGTKQLVAATTTGSNILPPMIISETKTKKEPVRPMNKRMIIPTMSFNLGDKSKHQFLIWSRECYLHKGS